MKIPLLYFFLIIIPCSVVQAQSTENINFTTYDGLNLPGTFYKPVGNGPFTTVVMVHGSGPQDRNVTTKNDNEVIQCLYPQLHNRTTLVFKDIAEGLQDAGFAVLLYDKRTYAHQASLDAETIVLDDFIKDALSAVKYAKGRSDVDSNNIMLAGHSQGSTIIPYVALQTNIRALFSLAGPSMPMDSIISEQVKYLGRNCYDSAEYYGYAQQYLQAFQMMRNNTWPSGQAFQGAYAPFWRSWFQKSDSVIEAYQETGLPAYFTQGGLDYNVVDENFQRFQQQLSFDASHYAYYDSLIHTLTTTDNPDVHQPLIDTLIYWMSKETVGLEDLRTSHELPFSISIGEGDYYIKTKDRSTAHIILYNVQGQIIYENDFKENLKIEADLLPNVLFGEINSNGQSDVFRLPVILE